MTANTESKARTTSAKVHGALSIARTSTALRCAWPAIVLAAVCLLPFLNKPFVIDDPLFLTMAKQIAKHPTHPMDFDICWNSVGACGKAYNLTPGNGLMGFVLVPTILAGGHEWTAHLTQLLLAWIAIVAMASLVLRLGSDRWHATTGALLLVAIPPFLPMASTAMPDILAATLAVSAMERLAAWKAELRWRQAAGAAVALGLAGYARSHLVLLLPLGALFLLDSLRPREVLAQLRTRYWLWTPILAGGVVLVAIFACLREHDLAIKPPPVLLGTHHLRENIYTYLLYFAFPLPLAACWIASRLKSGRRWTVFILLAVAAVPCLLRWDLSLILFLAVVGFGVLASLTNEAAKQANITSLALMAWIFIPLAIVQYVHMPMKYLLPCTPAVILLCFKLLNGISVRIERTMIIAVIVASTGYSLLVLEADAEFAEFGRDALSQLIEPHVRMGERVWYGGQYWSYWYAPLDGAQLTSEHGPQPKPGDLVVVDLIADGESSPLKRFPHRTLVDAVAHNYRFGRTVGGGIGGLYSGFWLWTTGNRLEDRYELWRVD